MKILTFEKNKIAILIATVPINFFSINVICFSLFDLLKLPTSELQTQALLAAALLIATALGLLFCKMKRPRPWVYGSWILLVVVSISGEGVHTKMRNKKPAVILR